MNIFKAGIATATFALAALAIGCTDSAVDPLNGTPATDPYYAPVVDNSSIDSFSELPEDDELFVSGADSSDADTNRMPPPGGPRGGKRGHRGHDDRDSLRAGDRDHHPEMDSLRREGEPGRRGGWPGREAGRDFGRFGQKHYGRIVRQLDLSAEQDATLKTLLAELRECVNTAAAPYREARAAAFETLKAGIAEVRAARAAGTMTEDEAHAAVDALRAAYVATVTPLNEQLKAAAEACHATFVAAFEAILTPAQLELWRTLKP